MSDILDHQEFENQKSNREEEWGLYIGPHADYYVEKWRQIEITGVFSSFNLAAAFLGLFWMLYRKMYYVAGIYLAVVIALRLAEVFTFETMGSSEATRESWGSISNIVIAVMTGFLGNWMYYIDANRNIARIKSSQFSPASTTATIQERGGTAWAPVGIGLLVLLLLAAIMIYTIGNV